MSVLFVEVYDATIYAVVMPSYAATLSPIPPKTTLMAYLQERLSPSPTHQHDMAPKSCITSSAFLQSWFLNKVIFLEKILSVHLRMPCMLAMYPVITDDMPVYCLMLLSLF